MQTYIHPPSKYLSRDHRYRKKKKEFNGVVKDFVACRLLTSYEVYNQVFSETGKYQVLRPTMEERINLLEAAILDRSTS